MKFAVPEHNEVPAVELYAAQIAFSDQLDVFEITRVKRVHIAVHVLPSYDFRYSVQYRTVLLYYCTWLRLHRSQATLVMPTLDLSLASTVETKNLLRATHLRW